MSFTELRCKEVICVSDGRRLGFVCDVIIKVPEGCMEAILVPGPSKFFGLWGPWLLYTSDAAGECFGGGPGGRTARSHRS